MSQETNVIIMVHPTKNQLSEINPQIPSQRKARDCGTGMKSQEVNMARNMCGIFYRIPSRKPVTREN